MVIEELRWWQIDELLEIEEDLFGAEKWSAAMFWGELARDGHYRVAWADNQIVGYAGLAIGGPDESWVQTLAVRRDRQRRGIGDALL
ncbi:MAG: GNAT family N-acetyltransferase, partial [Micromonosporaceae bacterium]